MPSPAAPDASAKDHATPVILETARLRLRRMATTDAAFLLELLNEPAFIQNVADRNVRTPADAEAFIAERMLPSYQKFGFGFYIVELNEGSVAIGICGLVKRDTLDDVDIGYSLLTRHTGKGYAFEAASALLNHGREKLKISRIVGVTAPGNARSIKVLKKLGMNFEKMVKLPGFAGESMLFA